MELTGSQQRMVEAVKFLGRFLAAGAVLHLVAVLNPETFWIESAVADLTSAALNTAGVKAEAAGNSVFYSSTRFVIVRDCLGWKSVAAFLGLGFASQLRDWRFALGGVAVISGANLVRLGTTVVYAESVGFDLLHGFLWSWGLTGIAFLCWLGWLAREQPETVKGGFCSLRTFILRC